MKNKLLIFDLDGTLADTLYNIRDAVNACLMYYGYPQRTYGEVKAAIGDGAALLLRRSLPENELFEEERFSEIFTYFKQCYADTHDQIEECYAGLYDVVLELKKKGFKLAVLSNKPDMFVENIINKLFGEGVFLLTQGQTELPKKPDPTVPLMFCRQLDVSPDDTYFIGDSEVDVKTAKNSGMHSVAVSWGFRERKRIEAEFPEVIIDTPEQLLEYFSRKEFN